MSFQGRVMVQDVAGAGTAVATGIENSWVRNVHLYGKLVDAANFETRVCRRSPST